MEIGLVFFTYSSPRPELGFGFFANSSPTVSKKNKLKKKNSIQIVSKKDSYFFPTSFCIRQLPGRTRSMRAPSCELWRSLVKFAELWRTHNAIFMRNSLTFARVPVKVPHIHQSSGEGAFCMLSGIASCDLVAIRIWIRIVRCERPAKRQKHKPCETKARLFPPLLPDGSQESGGRRTVSQRNFCDAELLAKHYGETCH